MKVGIFFGGRSREREISFAGGRTVYDNLDKQLFEPVPIFVDNFGNFLLLPWQYLYKGSIRDFYPPAEFLPEQFSQIQIYADSLANLPEGRLQEMANSAGTQIFPHQFSQYFDFAFLALHGAYGEDGSLQGLLHFYQIPYSGSGILSSAMGMNKAFQKSSGITTPTRFLLIQRKDWLEKSPQNFWEDTKQKTAFPCVVRPANQGSSIGVSALHNEYLEDFCAAVDKAFFIYKLRAQQWLQFSDEEKTNWLKDACDLRHFIGLPVKVNNEICYTPAALFAFLEKYCTQNPQATLVLEAIDGENTVLIEEFIDGREFSCIVLRQADGSCIALPPTEIIKGKEVYDYRAKYLAGLSRKQTPMHVSDAQMQAIRNACTQLFEKAAFEVYARIDGFIKNSGEIILNDPNTTSGMLPSSFFFHQAAEIGLNPSQFITYIIRQSLWERQQKHHDWLRLPALLQQLDTALKFQQQHQPEMLRIAVIMGGYSAERHISVESGRNIYEKLSASGKYQPIPVFLSRNKQQHWQLHQIPINILLKDNADDIAQKIAQNDESAVLQKIRAEASSITTFFGNKASILHAEVLSLEELKQRCDGVFIALHGRPGEDGELQAALETYYIPYNGSGVESSRITIDKYATNQLLRKEGFSVAHQMLVSAEDFAQNPTFCLDNVEAAFAYPIIAKPVDDGCSAGVKLLKNRAQLLAFSQLIFRQEEAIDETIAKNIGLKPKEEFGTHPYFLIENYIQPQHDSKRFLEITGGLLTHWNNGKIAYEVFEPSEVLASDAVLSLEEKFLAGEGQNITPARFDKNPAVNEQISEKVRQVLGSVAQSLQVEGYARIDAFVDVLANNEPIVHIIEVNSLPGMTPATCIYHQAALNHYKPFEFIDQIIAFSLERNNITNSQ
ncbi:MAG: D-alanine--D-alanine ligase [Bacteroidetes bacterium]|nr:D-alanine--D-alanine ligase [Bacteroidota bacterium]